VKTDDRESGAGPALLCSPAPERVVASRTWTFGHGGPTVEAGTEFTLQPPTCFAAGYESAAGLVILAWEAANRIRIGDLVEKKA